jgi:glutaminyl-peptide cyclotransferase
MRRQSGRSPEYRMMFFRITVGLLIAILAIASAKSVSAAVPVYSYAVVKTFPHDPDAFTEGLFYLDGFLYESTGIEGKSSVRKIRLADGKVVRQRALASKYFGEGIIAWKGRLMELTWKAGVGFTYDLSTFKPRSQFHYAGEGWALTQDGAHIIMSDGTSRLRFLDPITLAETGPRLNVTLNGRPLANLNELEWVRGEIFANVWQTNLIVRINSRTGKVTGVIDLSTLANTEAAKGKPVDLPNGVAYDSVHDRLFVTGKLWPDLFEIKLTGAIPGEVVN